MRKVDRRRLTGVLWSIGTALLLLVILLLLHETHVNALEPLLKRFRAIDTHRCTDQSYWQEARVNLTHFKSSVLFSRERAEALNKVRRAVSVAVTQHTCEGTVIAVGI